VQYCNTNIVANKDTEWYPPPSLTNFLSDLDESHNRSLGQVGGGTRPPVATPLAGSVGKAAKFRSLYDMKESYPVPGSGLWPGSGLKVNQFVHVPTSVDTQHFIQIHARVFLSNLANRETDRQTNTGKTCTSSFVGVNNCGCIYGAVTESAMLKFFGGPKRPFKVTFGWIRNRQQNHKYKNPTML